MGKTAVFVLSTLQQLEPIDGEVSVLVMCHTRELAIQIQKEYERFTKYLPSVKSVAFFGGINKSQNIKVLNEETPVRAQKPPPATSAGCAPFPSGTPRVQGKVSLRVPFSFICAPALAARRGRHPGAD